MTNWIIVNINRVEICITTDKENSERERESVLIEIIALSMGGGILYILGLKPPSKLLP